MALHASRKRATALILACRREDKSAAELHQMTHAARKILIYKSTTSRYLWLELD